MPQLCSINGLTIRLHQPSNVCRLDDNLNPLTNSSQLIGLYLSIDLSHSTFYLNEV